MIQFSPITRQDISEIKVSNLDENYQSQIDQGAHKNRKTLSQSPELEGDHDLNSLKPSYDENIKIFQSCKSVSKFKKKQYDSIQGSVDLFLPMSSKETNQDKKSIKKNVSLPTIDRTKIQRDGEPKNQKQYKVGSSGKINFESINGIHHNHRISQDKIRRKDFTLQIDGLKNRMPGRYLFQSRLIKYDLNLFKDYKYQTLIIGDEVKIIIDKVNALIYHLDHIGDQVKPLFRSSDFKGQQYINKKLEQMIGQLWVIGKIIIQEFSKDTEQLGIKNLDEQLQQMEFVFDEVKAFVDSYKLLKEVFETFKNCVTAFKIINNNFFRSAEDIKKVGNLIDIINRTRYFAGEILEKFKVLQSNFGNYKMRNKEMLKIKKIVEQELGYSISINEDYQKFQEHSDHYDSQSDGLSTKQLLNQMKDHKKVEIKYESQIQKLLKLKEKLAFDRLRKQKKKMEGHVGKETYQLIDKLIRRNMSCKNLHQQNLLNDNEEKESNTARMKKEKEKQMDDYQSLLEVFKQKNLELNKTKKIEKALFFGANNCGDQIAANLRPLQRELHLKQHELKLVITNIQSKKQAIRGIQE